MIGNISVIQVIFRSDKKIIYAMQEKYWAVALLLMGWFMCVERHKIMITGNCWEIMGGVITMYCLILRKQKPTHCCIRWQELMAQCMLLHNKIHLFYQHA